MRVTSKGQVTIPQYIREKLEIGPGHEVDFVEDQGRVYVTRKPGTPVRDDRFRRFRGAATVRMRTEEIMALTRGWS
jgi:AbrB family looped-hinge helix DNA binding protein